MNWLHRHVIGTFGSLRCSSPSNSFHPSGPACCSCSLALGFRTPHRRSQSGSHHAPGLLLLVLAVTMQIGVDRLWRPAAQRQVRNGWAALHAERSAWEKASSAMFQAASALVNLRLNRRYVVVVVSSPTSASLAQLSSSQFNLHIWNRHERRECSTNLFDSLAEH